MNGTGGGGDRRMRKDKVEQAKTIRRWQNETGGREKERQKVKEVWGAEKKRGEEEEEEEKKKCKQSLGI